MKFKYITGNGRIEFELEAATPKAAFEAIAAAQEVFEEADCGCCGSPAIRFEVREFDSNKYFKLVCGACHAQLDFGQNKDTVNIFPKRFDKDTKKPLPHRGWYVWQGQKDERQADVPRSAPQQAPKSNEPTPVLNAREFLKGNPDLTLFNRWFNQAFDPLPQGEVRNAVWFALDEHAGINGWKFDDKTFTFVKG